MAFGGPDEENGRGLGAEKSHVHSTPCQPLGGKNWPFPTAASLEIEEHFPLLRKLTEVPLLL